MLDSYLASVSKFWSLILFWNWFLLYERSGCKLIIYCYYLIVQMLVPSVLDIDGVVCFTFWLVHPCALSAALFARTCSNFLLGGKICVHMCYVGCTLFCVSIFLGAPNALGVRLCLSWFTVMFV